MRASKLLADLDARAGALEVGKDWWFQGTERRILAMLATTQAAVEQLAREAGTGPARRVAAILDGDHA